MGPNLLLAASLVLGQAVDYDSPLEGPIRRGTITTSGKTYTRSYSRTWSSSGGWVTSTSEGWRDDRSGGRFGDRILSIFGKKSSPPAAGWQRVPQQEEPEQDEFGPRPTPAAAQEPAALRPAPALEVVPFPLGETPATAAPDVDPSVRPLPVAETRKPVPIPSTPARPAPTRIPLTPGGEITVEVVDPDAEQQAEIKPAAFKARRVELNPRFASRLAYAEDFSLIRGQLRIEGGVYEIHFAAESNSVPHRGSLVLEMKGDLSPLRDGDLVEVRGVLLPHGAGVSRYRPQVVQILERK